MTKKILLILVLLSIVITFTTAEMLTMIGVVNLTKITEDFFQESSAYRELEELAQKRDDYTKSKMLEIDALEDEKISALDDDNDELAHSIDEKISQKRQFIRDYYKQMNDQIRAKQDNLLTSSTFSTEIYETIGFVAETEGFSLILRAKDPNLMFFSPEVDITEKVIKRLRDISGN